MGVWSNNDNDFVICFQSNNLCSGIDNQMGFSGTYILNEADETIDYSVSFQDGRKINDKTDYILSNKNLTLTFDSRKMICSYKNSATNQNDIIGKWILENENQYPSFHIIEFKQNGAASVYYEEGDDIDNDVAWKFVNGKLRIYFDTDINYNDYLEGSAILTDNILFYICNYETGNGVATTPFRLRRI